MIRGELTLSPPLLWIRMIHPSRTTMSIIRLLISRNNIRICRLPMTLNTLHRISSHMEDSTTNQMEGGPLSTSGNLRLLSLSTREWHVSLRRKSTTNFFPSHPKTSTTSWEKERVEVEQKTLSSRQHHRLPLHPLRWEINLPFLVGWGKHPHLDFYTTTTIPICHQGNLLRQMFRMPPLSRLLGLVFPFTALLR